MVYSDLGIYSWSINLDNLNISFNDYILKGNEKYKIPNDD
jgi:hypothetical protein